jgi:hypothetical protein
MVYLAREEILARTELANAALENAEIEFRKFTSKELENPLKRLRDIANSEATSLESLKRTKQMLGQLLQSSHHSD